MKKTRNMTIEELLELEFSNSVLSVAEFSKIKGYFVTILAATIQQVFDISTLYLLENSYRRYREKNPINIELHRLYNQLLNDLSAEINQLPFEKDPLSISILLGDYLIPSGILSYTKNFYRAYSDKIRDKIFLNEATGFEFQDLLDGLYVMAGYGCCRHVNSFVSDLLATMNVKSDKITCMIDTAGNLQNRKKENNLIVNHLVIGYVNNNKYHLIDSYNHIYSIIKSDNVLITNSKNMLIPNFQGTIFQKKLHWHHDMEYQSFTEDEVEQKKAQIITILQNASMERFQKFKQDHFELLEKLAYLGPIELERSVEKEKQKRKEYRKN